MNTPAYITLSQLTATIQSAIRVAFSGQSAWIVADITSHSYYPAKGYHYFDLVEKDPHSHQLTAKISASAWGNGSQRIREFEQVTGQRFGNDMHVLVKVAVEYHAVYGLKLSLLDIDTSFTIGMLEQQKQATLQKLLTECAHLVQKTPEGYLTFNKQQRLNAVVQRIAVVSSAHSAGYQDFMHTLQANSHGYIFHTDNYFTVVQGEANAAQLCAQLDAITAAGCTYDAVVIIRGGGAQTDLLLFDQYVLGKAIAGFPIPVITGIGHQKNETIADMMAHTAVKTPTRAAELIIAHNRSFEEALLNIQQQLIIRMQQLMRNRQQQLGGLHSLIINRSRDLLITHREALNRSRQAIPQRAMHIAISKQQNVQHLQQNIQAFSRKLLQQQMQQLQHHETIVRIMSPEALLQKGFALIYRAGEIVTEGLQVGDEITIKQKDGEAGATITAKNI